MIGEKVGEFTGRNTGRRVIPSGHDAQHGPKMEVSMEQSGKFYGIETVDYGTYETVLENGYLKGTGQGISMTKDGETITWTATGVGRFTGKGQSIQWRGSVYYTTTSTKLSKINGQCYVYEYDILEDGNTTNGRVYEWR